LQFGDLVVLAGSHRDLHLSHAVRPQETQVVSLSSAPQTKNDRQRRLIEPARLAGEDSELLLQSRTNRQSNTIPGGRAAGAFVASPHAGRLD
jgi:hypothetical protein